MSSDSWPGAVASIVAWANWMTWPSEAAAAAVCSEPYHCPLVASQALQALGSALANGGMGAGGPRLASAVPP